MLLPGKSYFRFEYGIAFWEKERQVALGKSESVKDEVPYTLGIINREHMGLLLFYNWWLRRYASGV